VLHDVAGIQRALPRAGLAKLEVTGTPGPATPAASVGALSRLELQRWLAWLTETGVRLTRCRGRRRVAG